MGRLSRPRPRVAAPQQSAAALPERGSARQRGYTARWDRASKGFLAAHPLCCGCVAAGFVVAATLTDHIVPHRGAAALFWDRDNWQPSCTWHHSAVKQALEERWVAGQLSADALRLDSPMALALAAAMGGGVRSLQP
jgi:hypothetical protein